MNKVSVIIPVYNTEKYLKRCINSVINQSLYEIEIIIVNDGSTDKSLKIICEFLRKDTRIKLINKKNEGLSEARNSGIAICTGEYIFNLDSDDWIEKDYLKDTYEYAKSNNLDIVVSDIFIDFDNGKIEYKKDLEIPEGKVITSQEYLELFFSGKILPSVWNKLVRKEIYIFNNVKHPKDINLGEDLATTPILAYYSKRIGKKNKAYIHYIQNQQGLTKNNKNRKIYELIDAFNLLENFFYNDKLKIKELKVSNMNSLITDKYDINDKFYEKALSDYIELHKDYIIKKMGKKNYLFSFILNKSPHIRTIKKLNKVYCICASILRKI